MIEFPVEIQEFFVGQLGDRFRITSGFTAVGGVRIQGIHDLPLQHIIRRGKSTLHLVIDHTVDGYAYKTAIESFNSAKKSIGGITAVGDAEATIDDDQIIVHVDVTGAKQNAQAEVIFSNDMFLSMESAALNPVESMGGLMTKAALNTLIGMGTVFVMLIMISLIISLFNFIPKIQAAFSKKDKEEEAKNAGIDKAVTQIVAQEEPEADDTELVAVIAAAIAASEGAASTDGFVVRSIRKVR